MQLNDLNLRRLVRADRPGLCRLLEAEKLPVAGLSETLDDFVGVGAEGRPVGAAGVETFLSGAERVGLLRSVVVDRDARGRGLGKRLVLDRIRWACEAGYTWLFLLTRDAQRFFASLEFEEVASSALPTSVSASPEFATPCAQDATAMGLALGERVRTDAVRKIVRDRYARRAVSDGDSAGCAMYRDGDVADLPKGAVRGSLACGNPLALLELRPGDDVLDLGSGAGLDVLLAARRVAPDGIAYGVDMTDEMVSVAKDNQQRAGVVNARFLRGTIEDLPLPDGSVDAVVSNCVLNLSADRPAVFLEAHRVLRPGGRLAIADIVRSREVPKEPARRMEALLGCVSGTLRQADYLDLARRAGFESLTATPTLTYQAANFGAEDLAGIDGAFVSIVLRAVRPA